MPVESNLARPGIVDQFKIYGQNRALTFWDSYCALKNPEIAKEELSNYPIFVIQDLLAAFIEKPGDLKYGFDFYGDQAVQREDRYNSLGSVLKGVNVTPPPLNEIIQSMLGTYISVEKIFSGPPMREKNRMIAIGELISKKKETAKVKIGKLPPEERDKMAAANTYMTFYLLKFSQLLAPKGKQIIRELLELNKDIV